MVFLFLLPGLNARLRPRLAAQLRPGARVLSAHFQARAAHSSMCTLAHVLYTLACALCRVRLARAYAVTMCIRRGPHMRSHMHSMHLSQCVCTLCRVRVVEAPTHHSPLYLVTDQVLGWPCGASLRIGSATFHKWRLPVQAAKWLAQP